MPLLPGNDHSVVDENVRELRRSGYAEDRAIAIALHKARETEQGTQRSVRDIARDLGTIRSGKMPDASKAAAPVKPESAEDADPVEKRRMALATKRNKGLNKDVELRPEKY